MDFRLKGGKNIASAFFLGLKVNTFFFFFFRYFLSELCKSVRAPVKNKADDRHLHVTVLSFSSVWYDHLGTLCLGLRSREVLIFENKVFRCSELL